MSTLQLAKSVATLMNNKLSHFIYFFLIRN